MLKKHTTNFYYLFFSQLTANFGDILYIIGIITYIYKKTGTATASALIPVIITSGMLISGIISPYIYQHLTKRNTLLIFQTLKTLIMLLILMLVYIDNSLFIWIYLLIFINSLFDGFTNPIKNSMIPLIEDSENITTANAKINTMNNIIQVGTWALGGILVVLLGNVNIVILTIITYVLSIIFIANIHNIYEENNDKKDSVVQSFTKMLSSNFHSKWSIFLNVSTLIESFAHSVWIASIILIYVHTFLHIKTFWFGFINATFFGGLILAGILVNFADKYFERRFKIYVIGLPILISLINVSFALHTSIIIALMFSLLYGFSDQIRTIVLHSTIQLKLTDTQLTNTYILNTMVYSFSFAIGTLTISYIVDKNGVIWAFIIGGLAYLVVFVFGLIFQKKINISENKE